jgi:prepilin-type N-terminal cleavage/methylation domain-containing protein
MSMNSRASRGFSLVELAITLVVFGLVLAMTVPAFRGFSASHQLKGAIANVNGQLRLGREKAIASGTTQTLRFMAGFQGSDYHVWNGTVANPKWSLPNGISYYWGAGTQNTYRMTREGRCLDSGMIILQDARGNRDTVSVQISGFVLSY